VLTEFFGIKGLRINTTRWQHSNRKKNCSWRWNDKTSSKWKYL